MMDEKNEPAGYCLIWSMFFAELCLKNPDKTSSELIEYVFKTLPKDDKISNVLRRICQGYVHVVYEKITKYVSKYFPDIQLKKGLSLEEYNAVLDKLDDVMDLRGSSIDKKKLSDVFKDVSEKSWKTSKKSISQRESPIFQSESPKKSISQRVKKTTCNLKTHDLDDDLVCRKKCLPGSVRHNITKRCRKGDTAIPSNAMPSNVMPLPTPKNTVNVETKVPCGKGIRCIKGTRCIKGFCTKIT
jgi:hypothetical protein